MPAVAATRDKELRRARAVIARSHESSRVTDAPRGGSLMRRLLLVCVLFIGVALVNGCSAGAPSAAANTTADATQSSGVRPATAERAGEVRGNVQPSPNASVVGASSSLETAKETTKGAAGVAGPTQTAGAFGSSSEQEGGAASAAYEGFYEVMGARPKGFEQFGNFMIRAPEGGRISGAVVPLEGKVYEFARATLDGRKLTFVTQKVGGVNYSFEGQFLAAPPFAGGKKTAVAEGLVRKFRHDQMAAEASMKFYFDEGGEEP